MPSGARTALRRAVKAAGLILGCAAAGYLLLVLAYCLPTGRMVSHVRQSAAVFENEGQHPQLAAGYDSAYLDNYSDAVMLKEAIYTGPQPPPQKAVANYLAWGQDQAASLLRLLDTGAPDEVYAYSRYWHGYLILLKPLLLVFDYGELRLLNAMAQLLLVAAVLACAVRAGRGWLVLPLATTYALLLPPVLAASLHYSGTVCIAFAALLPLMGRLRAGRGVGGLFVFLGCLTCYWDLISTPLLTLGLPLAVWAAWRRGPAGPRLAGAVRYSVGWGAGYLGLWVCKWGLAALALGPGAITEALQVVRLRTSAAAEGGMTLSALAPLLRNLGVYARPLYLALLAAVAVWYAAHWRAGLDAARLRAAALPLLAVACLPVLWCLAAKNHCWEHWYYTHRIFAISWLCATALPACALKI